MASLLLLGSWEGEDSDDFNKKLASHEPPIPEVVVGVSGYKMFMSQGDTGGPQPCQ